MRESTIERNAKRRAKDELGIKSIGLKSAHDRGKSDQLFLKNRIAAFVEFKAPGKKPTPLQAKFLRERREDGFDAEWFDNVEKCLAWLRGVYGA